MMKHAPMVLVTATLMVAILLAASLLIVTSTHGETAPQLTAPTPAVPIDHLRADRTTGSFE